MKGMREAPYFFPLLSMYLYGFHISAQMHVSFIPASLKRQPALLPPPAISPRRNGMGVPPQAKRNLCLNSNDVNANKTMRPSPAEIACLQRPPYRRWRVAHHTQLRNTSARTAINTTKRRDFTNLEPFARKCTTHAAPRCHWRRPLTPIPLLRFDQKLRHF